MNQFISEVQHNADDMASFFKKHSQHLNGIAIAEEQLRFMMEYREFQMRYICAMKEIRTKFEVLSTEFGVRYERNPIAGISTRLKSTTGIIEKLKRQNLDVNMKNMREHIRDIAGVRVICSYIDDIYLLADALKRQKDITLLCEKDYIQNPKPNGYRSLHLIVNVPVFFEEQTYDITVEVQIRTIAMDFWASLEHEIRYKQSTENTEQFAERLRICAETIARTDREMQAIRKEMEENCSHISEEERLIRQIKRMDTPIGKV